MGEERKRKRRQSESLGAKSREEGGERFSEERSEHALRPLPGVPPDFAHHI